MEEKKVVGMKAGEPVIGHVTGCVKLNVREAPAADSEIIGTLSAGSEVMIDESESTSEFYNICAASGFEGFCVKEYITISE